MKLDLLSLRKPIIVAEIGASHNGNMKRAYDLVYAAYEAGADAVKFQTYTPETLAVDRLIVGGPWGGSSYHDLYRKAMTPWEWLPGLFSYASRLGLIAFSSPFSIEAVRYLENIECPMYKIASPEVGYGELIEAASATRKPVVISTGLASAYELRRAVDLAVRGGASQLVLLHCVSAYPAAPEDYDLLAIENMVNQFHVAMVGISDHTLGSTVAVAAVALGAMMVEKHITLSRSDGGPDSGFASEPDEFARMVTECRIAAAACKGEFSDRSTESRQYKRSLWVIKPIVAGECFTRDNVAVLRPFDGLHPLRLPRILMERAACDIPANTALLEAHIAG